MCYFGIIKLDTMKKIIIRLLVCITAFTCFSYALVLHKEENCEHEHHYIGHVHETFAEILSECPYCHADLVSRIIPATCESDGNYYVYCPNGDYSDRGTIPKLGHDYKETVLVEATCTKKGEVRYECTRCGDSYKKETDALGHNYLYKVTKEATCTEEGTRKYTCTRCYDSYTKTIDALGHDFEYEEVEATCTKDGYKKGVCKRCGEETKEVYPALGHKLGTFKTVKEATCTEDGIKEAICSVCNETIKETIPKLGHKFPDEWTVEKEAGFFHEGIETKTCSVCGEKISQSIPKKDPTPLIIGGSVGVLAVIGGALAYFNKLKKPSKKLKKQEDVLDKDPLKPEFEDKSILVRSSNEELILNLKGKKFLEVSTCESEELKDNAIENEPDLIICEINSDEEYDTIIKLKEEELSEFSLSLILSKELIKKNEETLKSLKEEKKIVDYVTPDTDVDIMQVKLVLPVLKPKMNSDETLGNIGMVADALGIPYVSKIIDVYVTGRDLKATLEEEEKGVSEVSTIIGDIASILGFDTVASVAGLVDDIDSIRSALDSESGVHEKSAGIEGAKDIVDVVSDIVNKD